jgi:hypothetical protein
MGNGTRARWAWAIAVGVLAVAAYWRSLLYPFIADDYIQIRLGRWLGDPVKWRDLIADPLYRCRATSLYLTNLTEHFFGLEPLAYNVSSVLLHAAISLLVGVLVRTLGLGALAAASAAGFYAVYEGQQEAVIWYSALPEQLVVGFAVGSLLAWRQWLDRERGGLGWYAMSLGLFGLALASKESGVVVAPLLIWMALWGRSRSWPWILGAAAPFAVLAGVYAGAILAVRGQHQFFADGTFTLGPHVLLVLPRSMGSMLFFWGALAAVAVGWSRVLRFSLAWMVLALVPYSFLTYMSRVPSRHTYFAGVGLALLVGAAVAKVAESRRRLVPALVCLMVVHNCGYLWTRKHQQYLERAAPTEQLLEHMRSQRGYTGKFWIVGFPYDKHVLKSAVEVATEMDPARMIFADWAPAGAQTLRWDQDLNRLVVLN